MRNWTSDDTGVVWHSLGQHKFTEEGKGFIPTYNISFYHLKYSITNVTLVLSRRGNEYCIISYTRGKPLFHKILKATNYPLF